MRVFYIGVVMKKIKLTQGKFALVDDEDFEYLNQFKWSVYKDYNTFYVTRQIKLPNGKHRSIKMHREIMKTPKGKLTDHADGNGLNNQKYNLRICTAQENNRNLRHRKIKSSKYKGVYLGNKKYWRAHIGVNSKQVYLGCFSSENEAALAYNEKAKELFGEFAYLNKIKRN
jgi:hypothetical protein